MELTRPVPTPRDIAAQAAVPACQAPATPAGSGPTRRFDRHTWEQAIRYSTLHPYSRLLAMMLAHYADGRGHIPSGEVLVAPRLAKVCGIPVQDVHISLNVLYRERYIDRGEAGGHTPRSVTLTLPPSYRRPQHLHSPGGRP
jgi:hypothetical protein